jgi:multidrug efflux pump subunit AcrB
MVNYWFGYTINRVTLFALVLALGLLVDDPIVDVENIYRHFKMRKEPPRDAVLTAVDEVRPPVILATLAVILSFLPMLFITGMMGPYMRPMAINLPLTMIMSLLVAFTVTPWMTYHVLKGEYGKEEQDFVLEESRTYRLYRRLLSPFLDDRRKGLAAGRGGGAAAVRFDGHAGPEPGAAEDAPLRQQERVPTGARPARRNHSGDD